MTSTVITDAMVETFGNSQRKLAGLEPASYADMLETTPKAVEHIRLHLEVVAPMILEEALRAQPSTAENPNESAYERGRFDGVMAFAAAIRSLKEPRP